MTSQGERKPSNDPERIQRVFRTSAETRAFYNKISRVYDLLAEHSEAPVRAKGLKLLAARPGESVLEVGFGTGHCLVDLARSVGGSGRVVGVDISQGMALRARRNVERMKAGGATLVACGDAFRLPLPNACMDALFSSFTLELFDTPDIPRALAEWRRVLRPGARFVIVSLSKSSKELAVKAYEWSHRHFPNFVDCRPIYVEEALTAAGFEIEGSLLEHMWVPVEVVLARCPGPGITALTSQ